MFLWPLWNFLGVGGFFAVSSRVGGPGMWGSDGCHWFVFSGAFSLNARSSVSAL